jgi:endonuclease-8
MEGPSLFLAAEQLAPFKGQKILSVTGNTKIGKERFEDKKILDIFSWGKHLVFQFDTFALRVHFMLFGSFRATVQEKSVTGDYPTKNRTPRLSFICKVGHIEFYSCSLKFIEDSNANETYDYSIDIMSPYFDPKVVIEKIRESSDRGIGDLLLDQTIFAGVGNIMKNEILSLEKLSPKHLVSELSPQKLKKLITTAKKFSTQFYTWRKAFVLKKHYQVYHQKTCPHCEKPITRVKTGHTDRWSYFCPHCQK